MQVFQRKLNRFTVAGRCTKAGKVADDDDLRQVAFGNARKMSSVCLNARTRKSCRATPCSTSSMPGQNRSMKPWPPPCFLTFSSKVATRLSVMPKISKKAI